MLLVHKAHRSPQNAPNCTIYFKILRGDAPKTPQKLLLGKDCKYTHTLITDKAALIKNDCFSVLFLQFEYDRHDSVLLRALCIAQKTFFFCVR